ncbi:MAG: thermonuclease family protein [Thainema sp.]
MFQRWYHYKWLILSSLAVVGMGLALIIFAVINSYNADVADNRPVSPSISTDTAQNTASPSSQAPTAVDEETNTEPLYTVSKIYDGDTIDAFRDGETITVRLACIDSPESAQAPHGADATERLSSLISGQIQLNVVDQDAYGRTVAEVYTAEGNFINLQMLESGDAVVYTQYLSNCGNNADELLAAEERARSTGKGVWGDLAFIKPWDYRQGKRPVTASSTPAVSPSAPSATEPSPTAAADLPACINSDCDCGDFSSWRQAQDVLESSPGDPHRLDGDDDRVACESLR